MPVVAGPRNDLLPRSCFDCAQHDINVAHEDEDKHEKDPGMDRGLFDTVVNLLPLRTGQIDQHFISAFFRA